MSIKALLTRILTKLDAPFIVRTYSLTNQSATTWYKNFAIGIGIDGYSPIAFRNITLGQANKTIYWHYFSADGTIANLGVANTSASGTIASLTINIDVFYIKDDLLS